MTGYRFVPISLGNTISTSINVDVETLHHELERFIDCDITLIGMSKGGLPVVQYAKSMKFPNIKRAITISSPLRGTRLSNFLSKNYIIRKELEYESETTMNIARQKTLVPIYHIVPRWDHIIIPTKSAYYDNTPESNIYHYNGNYGHTGIIYAPEVIDVICKWITQE